MIKGGEQRVPSGSNVASDPYFLGNSEKDWSQPSRSILLYILQVNLGLERRRPLGVVLYLTESQFL